MAPSSSCKGCKFDLHAHTLGSRCPECGLPVLASFAEPGHDAGATMLLVAASLAYPLLTMLAVIGEVDGLGFLFLAPFIAPAVICGIAFACSAAGVRFHRAAVAAVLILLGATAAISLSIFGSIIAAC